MARLLAAVVLVLGACSGEVPAPRPVSPAPAAPGPAGPIPDGRLPPSEPVREAGRTVFLPHRTAPFDPAKENAVWCATFEMAWQALGRDVLKGPLRLGPPAPAAFVDGMNAHPFPADALDPASCIAMAGTKADGILERIAREGREKFGRDLPGGDIDLPTPGSLLAYAFLLKNLPFEFPFETILDGIPFRGSEEPVRAFGIEAGSKNIDLADIVSQVTILFDEGAEDAREFALGVRTRGGKDDLVLARVRPGATMAQTWQAAARRSRGEGTPLPAHPVLGIPKVHFDLEHEFAELAGAPVLGSGFDGYTLARARESVLFRMDETGLVLEAGASSTFLEEEIEEEPPPAFLFDRPFLIALIEKGAEEPYFLAWIANTDLMPR